MEKKDISQKNKKKFNPNKKKDINRYKRTKNNANHTRNHRNSQKAKNLEVKQNNQHIVDNKLNTEVIVDNKTIIKEDDNIIEIVKKPSNLDKTIEVDLSELNKEVFEEKDINDIEDPTIEIRTIDLDDFSAIGNNNIPIPEMPMEMSLEEPIIEEPLTEETVIENSIMEQAMVEQPVIEEEPVLEEVKVIEEQPIVEKQEETTPKEEPPKKPKKQPFYLGYKRRLALYLVLSIFLILFANFIIKNNIQFTNEKSINYREQSNLDYKVYLKPNTFYDREYLDKGMSYIAGLIDKINIDFVYTFASDSDLNVNFNYDVVGVLEIKDETGSNTYFTKEYIILESKNHQINNKTYGLRESVSIDYNYYNNLANNFKSAYGINTQSNLKVFLRLNKSTPNPNLSMQNTGNMYVTIPLSQKAINIGLDYKDINETHNVIDESKVKVNNYLQIGISITLYLVALYFLYKFLKLVLALKGNTNKYDKYVNKILFQYDRLIIESNEDLDIKDYNVIPIKQFKELLDARDNLKAPIMYKPLIKHQKCYFYIKKHEDLYLLIVKEVDIDNGTLK